MGGGANYTQSTRLGSKAGQSFDLPISNTVDFNRPPVEVLKFKQGSTEVQTKNTFDSSEASDFVINGQEAVNNGFDYVSLDGTIHPKISYIAAMSTPVAITDGTTTGYISESDEIDFSDWDDVLGVVIR